MIPKIWRLSENSGDDNLGLACTEQGLVLGRTPLIERRDGRFVVRERSELEYLFSLAYGREASAQRLMSGLATVASALNANDQGLARIAAVHLRIPDLPDQAARRHRGGGCPHQIHAPWQINERNSQSESGRSEASRLARRNGRRTWRTISSEGRIGSRNRAGRRRAHPAH